jgi:hypothetical protein
MLLIRQHHNSDRVLIKKDSIYRELVTKIGINKGKNKKVFIRGRRLKNNKYRISARVKLRKRYSGRFKRRRLTVSPRVIHIGRLRRRLKKRIKKINGIKTTNRSHINAHHKSFFRRFLLRKRGSGKRIPLHIRGRRGHRLRRRLFYVTARIQPVQVRDTLYLKEPAWFQWVRSSIKFYENKKFRKFPFRYRRHVKRLHNREFYLGRIFVRTCKRNTFIHVEEIVRRQSRMRNRVIYKASCSLVGYKGIKRKTDHARVAVSKNIGFFLGLAGLTTIDIIFVRSLNFWHMRKFMRGFLPAPICVRSIIVKIRRTHGFTRRKKIRRK